MTPRMVVRHFGPGYEHRWLRLLRVLDYTAREHCREWTLDVQRVEPPAALSSPLGRQGHVWNTVKLDSWVETVESAPNGEQLALFDADLAILRPLDVIWTRTFDLAYTGKPKGSRFPLNGGVIFLRVSEAVRRFLRAWRDRNRFYLEHPQELQVWDCNYGGLNQTALGMLIRENVSAGLHVEQLPCLEWNCEDEHWARFDPAVTRIVHYKSNLQRALWKLGPTPDGAKPLRLLWHALEKDAMRAESTRTEVPA